MYSTINIGRELLNGRYICPWDKKIMLGAIKMYSRVGEGYILVVNLNYLNIKILNSTTMEII